MESASTKSNICILANRHRTWFYDALVKKMGLDHRNVFWIVTGQPWLQALREAGYSDANILYYEVASTEKDAGLDWLAQLELSMSMPIWRLIHTDRFLSQRTTHPDRFLNRVGLEIECFLNRHAISHCFGEATWSVELLTYFISKRAAIQYLIPHTIRIPSERFAFFTDPFQSDYLRPGIHDDDWNSTCRSMVARMVDEGNIPRPHYWYINNEVPAVRLRYVGKFVRFLSEELFHEARTEYMDYSISERVRMKLRMIRNKRQLDELPHKSIIAKPTGSQYALFALHKQPEASVDVMGGIYTNQLALIEVLSKSLPMQYTLLVKEHSNAIGDRGSEFYRTILSLGNVTLVAPSANSHELLKHVDVVFSVSGTIGMEASLLGVKALMFCPTFFTNMPNVYFLEDLSSLHAALDSPLVEHKALLLEFYEELVTNSYNGLIGDPICLPAAMTEENLSLVAVAFKDILAASMRKRVASV